MAFCPTCKYEYNPDIKVCPDCGIELITQLPPQPEVPNQFVDDGIVAVYMTENEIEAEILQGVLNDAGIPSWLRTPVTHNIPIHILTRGDLSIIEIMVAESHAESAHEILKSHLEGKDSLPDEVEGA